MELKNTYLNQANFFTRSLFKLDREIHKDIVYLIQSKIDFYGKTQSIIRISLNDYLIAKNIKKNDTYSFNQFHQFASEIKNVGGAFYNKINHSFINFNIVDNVQIDFENSETLIIELGQFGKIFFFEESLKKYIQKITPNGKTIKYIGHTQVNNRTFKIRGIRRKKFYEIISQFKNTGFCKISVVELKMYLGYIEMIPVDTYHIPSNEVQLKLIFIPHDKFKLKDRCPNYSYFERDFLIPAIKSINDGIDNEIQNLRISKKSKTGTRITHLEFMFHPLGKDLKPKEIDCLTHFKSLGLDRAQVIYLINLIGPDEMYNRYINNVMRKTYGDNKTPKYYEVKGGKEIKNLSGYLYQVLFKELQ